MMVQYHPPHPVLARLQALGEQLRRVFVFRPRRRPVPSRRDSHAIIVGKAYGRVLGYSGESNVWVCAPPGTRKTWGIVFPTLLTYTGSVVVHDVKGECYDMTAGFRGLTRAHGGLGQQIVTYNPASLHTHRHNPFEEIRLGINEVKDARNFVDMLIDPEATKDRRDHWDKAVSPTLIGATLHLLYTKPQRQQCPEGLAYFLADATRNVKQTFEEMRGSSHPIVASMAQEVLQKSPNDMSGVISTAMDYVGIYRDPLLAHLTRRSDFTMHDLQFGPVPVSLYLLIPPSDLAGTRPVVRVFLNQLMTRLAEDFHEGGRRELLYVLDEFNALGKVDFLTERLGYMRGYHMRALIINQSVPQLWNTWGRDEPITATCDLKVFFTAPDVATAEAAVDLLTKKTVVRHQSGMTRERGSPFTQRRSVSETEMERPLLTKDEMLLLDDDKMAVFPKGHPRIYADKFDFLRESWLQRRCLPAPPTAIPYEDPPALDATVPASPAPSGPGPEVSPRPAPGPAVSLPDEPLGPRPTPRKDVDLRYVLGRRAATERRRTS